MILNEFFDLENTQNLDFRLLLAIGTLIFLSLIFIGLGIRRFLRGKPLTACIQSLSGVSLCLASLLFLSIATNLYSYSRLTYEQPVAKLRFRQLEDQQFQVEISYQNENKVDSYVIKGDEWQIDARVIKWHGWAQLLGLNAQYRLERISGRYSNIEEERGNERSVYALGDKDQIDYWKFLNKYKKHLPWVDTYYGSATYFPMSDNADYSVSLTQSGLIARSLNTESDEIIKLW